MRYFLCFTLYLSISSNILLMSAQCRHNADTKAFLPFGVLIRFMRKKLSSSIIAKLTCPESKSQFKLFDSEVTGLAVRVTKQGVKTFIFERRPRGSSKIKQEKIGRCSDISLEQARQIARRKSVDYDDSSYLQRLREASLRENFDEVFEKYLAIKMPTFAASTREKQIGLFKREVTPILGKLPIENITRRHLSMITLKIQESGRHGTASDVWKSVSAFLTWCVHQGFLASNPVLGATPSFFINEGSRVLNLEEVVSIWHAAQSCTPIRRSAIRLLLLLPLRKSELTNTIWAEVQNGMINISANRTKNGRELSLYLTEFAEKQMPRRRNNTDFLFSTNGRTGTRLDDKLKKRILTESGIEHFNWHDNRRTFSSHLNSKPNADYEAIEACLNHVPKSKSGVAGVYNRADFTQRMKFMLQAWSDIVEQAVGRC